MRSTTEASRTPANEYRCEPSGTRATQAFGAFCYWGVATLVAVLVMRDPPPYLGVAATAVLAPMTVIATWRGFRLSIVATTEGVVVKNLWTTRHVSWDAVSDVSFGWRSVAIISRQPVLVLRGRGHRSVIAHGVPRSPEDQEYVRDSLLKLAPPSVVFQPVRED